MFIKNFHHLLAETCVKEKKIQSLASLKHTHDFKLIQTTYYLLNIDVRLSFTSNLLAWLHIMEQENLFQEPFT